MVNSPEEWQWSSWHSIVGNTYSPRWLLADAILLQFSQERGQAIGSYKQFVTEGVGVKVWPNLRQQVYLGDEAFVAKHLTMQDAM